MKKIGWIVACLLLLTSCGAGSYTYRYRIVVEALVNNEVKSGSSVVEVTTWDSGGWGFSEAAGIRQKITAEAVFVDLGNDRNVVALLRFPQRNMDFIGGLAEWAFEPYYPGLDWKSVSKIKGQVELSANLMPYLVSFSDRFSPDSAILIHGTNLESVLGTGSRLKRIYIEMTDAPVSKGLLQTQLPWITDYKSALVAAKKLLSQGLNTGGSYGPVEFFKIEMR